MAFSVTALKRIYLVRQWQNIIANHSYVAVLQLTGGRSWGRTNMRARVLGDRYGTPEVGAKYAVPWAARAGAEQTRFVGLATLFQSAPSAVIFGHEISAVLDVIARTRKEVEGSILLGGRFGDTIVSARVWDEVGAMESEDELRLKLIQLLSAPPGFLRILDGNAARLTRVLQGSGASARSLVRVLERHSHGAHEAELTRL
jgi:ribosomal protein L10